MNPSVFICPHCQAKLKPKNALLPGKSVRCPGCKELFTPEAETYAVEPPQEHRLPSERVQAGTAALSRAAQSVAEQAETAANEQDSGTALRPRTKKRAKKKPAASGPPARLIAGLRRLGVSLAAGAPISSRPDLSGKGLRSLGVLLVAGAVIFAVVKFVARPTTPPWQRKLAGEDISKAQQLTKQTLQCEAKGKFAEALKAAEELAQLREQRQGADHWEAVTARWEVDAIERAQGQPEQSRQDYSSTFALGQRAQAFGSKGRFRDAQPLLENVLAIRRKVLGEEHPRTAASYHAVALNLNAQGKYAEAEKGFRLSLAIRRKVLGVENPALAESYNFTGQNLVAEGKCAEAEESYRNALAISITVLGEEHAFTAEIYNSIAMNLNAQGKFGEAEAGLRKALAINRKVVGEDHRLTARGYNNVAFNLGAQGKVLEAEAGFRKALAICRKVLGEEHPQTALGYNNTAANLGAQGKYAEAEEGFRKALAIRQKVLGEEHPRTAETYNSMARNLGAQRKYAEAEAGFRKALAIHQKLLGEQHPRTAASFNFVGLNLTDQGKYAEADQVLRHALAIRRKVLGEEHPDTAASYSNVARNLNAQGKYTEAEQFWTRAVDRFSKAREGIAASGLDRATITAERSPLPSLAAVLARKGKPEPAWRRFEESLGRGTLDDLSARLSRPAAEQAKEAGLVARLSRIDELIESAASDNKPTNEEKPQSTDLLTEQRKVQDELNEFNRYLEKSYGQAAGEVSELHKIQAALPAYTALVGWLDLPGQPQAADPNGEHWAFALRSSGGPVVVHLQGTGPKNGWSDADTQLPADLRSALLTQRGEWQPLAERLRKQRLDPLRSHLAASAGLPAVRRLIVLPSAALAGVPVEVFAAGYSVSYALSGTLYARQTHQPDSTSNGLLALADPIFERPRVEAASRRELDDGLSRGDDDAWQPLPGTRIEAEALRQLSAGQQSTVLSDSLASEQKLYDLAQSGDLGKYRYLHFATHGTADERFPLHSAIILSRDNLPDPGKQLDAGRPVFDGQLTAEEVLRQWHLSADLVTLSACQTALGKYERGEGYVGFAQALILAGSRAVCLSLWKVDDTATALLMSRFYANMLGQREGLSRPMTKAVALAEAKTWLRGLSGDQAKLRTDQLGTGVARGKGRPALPVLPEAAKVAGAAKSESGEDRPYAHPYYWAAFVLIGDPD